MAQGQIVFTRNLINTLDRFIEDYNQLTILRRNYDTLGLSGTFTAEEIEAAQIYLRNGDVSIIANAVTSIDAIKTVMEAGHLTNIMLLLEGIQ